MVRCSNVPLCLVTEKRDADAHSPLFRPLPSSNNPLTPPSRRSHTCTSLHSSPRSEENDYRNDYPDGEDQESDFSGDGEGAGGGGFGGYRDGEDDDEDAGWSD